MARLIVVIGLPGSGKTTYCENLDARHGRVFDDFRAAHKIGADEGLEGMLRCLAAGENCVGNETSPETDAARREFEALIEQRAPGTEIEWRCFENDPVACEANVRAAGRNDTANRLCWLRKYTLTYTIPEGVEAMRVYRRDAPAE